LLLAKNFLHSFSDNKFLYFFHNATASSGPEPHFRDFKVTLRHTTLSRTPLDEWSGRRTDLYLTTHNTHKTQTSLTPAGFEPAIPASERPQTHVLGGAATGIDSVYTGSWNSTQNHYLTNLHKIYRFDKLGLNLLLLMTATCLTSCL